MRGIRGIRTKFRPTEKILLTGYFDLKNFTSGVGKRVARCVMGIICQRDR